MTTQICNTKRDTIAIARNPEWLEGRDSQYPFVVLLIFGELKKDYWQESFDAAVDVARMFADLYHVNYIIEKGIDPEIDADFLAQYDENDL